MFCAAIVAVGLLGATSASANEPDTRRDEAVKAVDEDGNFRLDHSEMRALKKSYPVMYESLRDFCDIAKDDPEGNGVKLADDPTRKQQQCKKCHVARPYLNAWTALGKPLAQDPVDKVHIDHVSEDQGHAIP